MEILFFIISGCALFKEQLPHFKLMIGFGRLLSLGA
jgi:hypothetical protein